MTAGRRLSPRYTDAETGFQHLRARYYDPATGNFLNRDPLEALAREPYAYAGNDPVNNTDPTGLYWGEGIVDEVVAVGEEIIRNPGAALSDGAKGAGNFGVGFSNAALGTSFEGWCGEGQSWSRNIGSATFFVESSLGAAWALRASGFLSGRELSVGGARLSMGNWTARTNSGSAYWAARLPHAHYKTVTGLRTSAKWHRPWETVFRRWF